MDEITVIGSSSTWFPDLLSLQAKVYSSCCRLSHPHVAQGVYSLSSYVSWMISHMLTVLPCLIFPVYCAGLMIIISLVFISERLSVTAAKLAGSI